MFFANGVRLQAGETIRPPHALCQFLQLIADRGPDDFYEGEAARLVLDDLRALRSPITADDLRAQRSVWAERPLTVPLDIEPTTAGTEETAFDMHVPPLPAGGPVLAMIVRTLFGYDWLEGTTPTDSDDEALAIDRLSALRVHRQAEAFKWAFARRNAMGDPEFDGDGELDALQANVTSAAYAEYVRESIARRGDRRDKRSSAYDVPEGERVQPAGRWGTAHVSVVAPNGDAVAVTSSINY